MTSIIGVLGIIFGALVSVPQIIKSLREKSTKGVSLKTYQLLWLAILCYLVRAIAIGATIFIISNILNLITVSMMLYLFHRYRVRNITFIKPKAPSQFYWGYKGKKWR